MTTTTPMPTLREKRESWLETLRGDDRNSISNQLTELSWYFAVYEAILEARRQHPPATEGGVQLNGLLHELIDQGFLAIIASGVRRLADDIEYKKPERFVYSLLGLLNDMKKHIGLLRRREIFEAEGIEYDFSPFELRERNETADRIAAGGPSASHSPNEGNWRWSRHRHEMIDRLVRVAAADRRPTDQIPLSLLDRLTALVVEACGAIKTYATKYLAHAATPFSRLADNTVDPSYQDLEQALQTLCKVSAFIATHLLGDSFASTVAHPTFDHLVYFDRPLVARADVEFVRARWEEVSRRASEWVNWQPDEVYFSVEEERATAFRLAGEAVASTRAGVPLPSVRLARPLTDDLGYPVDEPLTSTGGVERRVALAGRLASYFGGKVGGSDARRAPPPEELQEFALTMLAVFDQDRDEGDPALREIRDLVVRDWPTIVKLAEELVAKKYLNDTEVAELIAESGSA